MLKSVYRFYQDVCKEEVKNHVLKTIWLYIEIYGKFWKIFDHITDKTPWILFFNFIHLILLLKYNIYSIFCRTYKFVLKR